MNAAFSGDIVITGHDWKRRGSEEWTKIVGLNPADSLTPLENTSIVLDRTTAYRVKNGRARALPWMIEGDGHVADAAGRIWSVVCGQPWIAQRTTSGRTCAE